MSPRRRDVQSVLVDGRRITYERAGDGLPLVLLHGGFGLDRRSWRLQEFHDNISGSKLVVMPGVAHFSSGEFPDRFNTEVRSFFRSLVS